MPRVAIQAVEHGVPAIPVLVVQQRVKGGKPFVQPDVAPVFAGDQVAEPLVGHFMRDQALAGTDVFRVGGEERVVRERGERRVFHAARDEIIDHHLVILGPRKGQADFILVKGHDVPGVAE